MLPRVAWSLASLIVSVASIHLPPARDAGNLEIPKVSRVEFRSSGESRSPAESPLRQPVEPQKAEPEQRTRQAQAIKAKTSERLLIVGALLAIVAMVGGILLLFFLVYRAGRAKALRLAQAPLNELWGLLHLQGLDTATHDLWILLPPTSSLSRTWTLFSRKSEAMFQLRLLRGHRAEWQGEGAKVHFCEQQNLNPLNRPIEVVVDQQPPFSIERAPGLGPGTHHFVWRGDSYQASYQNQPDRIELSRNGTRQAVSDLPQLAGSPRVLAVPNGAETALILIFAYVLLRS